MMDSAERPILDAGRIGRWTADGAALPVFELTAAMPPPADTPRGGPREPADPWFILGNHGLTVFVHASGGYQLLSTERGFARLNHDGGPAATGWTCRSLLVADGRRHELVGPADAARPARRRFGCGFAEFRHDLGNGLHLRRTLATVPSRNARDRVSAMLITVEIENGGPAPRTVAYTEGLNARYDFANAHNPPSGRGFVATVARPGGTERHATVRFDIRETRPLVVAAPGARAQADGHPAQLHLEVLDGAGALSTSPVGADAIAIDARWEFLLAPGERRELRCAVGYSLPGAPWPMAVLRLCDDAPTFREAWRARIPRFVDDDPMLALEMQWHAHALHAMATWDDFYQETFIPQGTVYEYALGVAACSRDHLQHALPACHYDRETARGVLRYVAKHTDVYGRIRHTDEGLGFVPRGSDEKSDSQIYAFMLLAEYLRVEPDAGLLREEVPYDGMIGRGTLLHRASLWLRYLRDCVHVGPHGLVRLMNADWNDGMLDLHFRGLRYGRVFGGESHLNTTMAIQVLGEFATAFAALLDGERELGDEAALAAELLEAVRDYRAGLLDAFIADLGERTFVARAYAGGQAVGLDEMFLEPQPHVLGIPEVPLARRRLLWDEIRRRLCAGERKGARQREIPGSRENGGFWFALNGPLVVNLAAVDLEAAGEALRRMTLTRHASDYPAEWIGMWSAGDSFDSDSVPRGASAEAGASTDADFRAHGGRINPYLFPFPVYCAHAHAWPLYAWLRLRGPGARPEPRLEPHP